MSEAAFAGRVVAVTGGTGALGRAVVLRMLEGGAECHATFRGDRDLRGWDEPPLDGAYLHRVDCADERAVEAFYAELPGLWASIHTVGGFEMAAVADTRAEDFEAMIRTNALTCFLCCREAVRRMRSGGGRIVNIGSRPAVAPTGGMIAYAAAKAAVASITTSLAEEMKEAGILVNAVLPSIMDTPATRGAMPDADFDRWPKLGQVAETIAFLASPANTLTSGALVPVYGRA